MEIEIVQWAAEECDRQNSGELSVAHMCEAWLYLTHQRGQPVTPDLIIALGVLVEPEKNATGYRRVPVWFETGDVVSAANIPHQIETLCDYGGVLTPIEWYAEFEKIHPFIDGNGRVGTLLFNFFCDTLFSPITPPDIFSNEYPRCLSER